MKYTYLTKGTCSRKIELEMENDVITEIVFHGGCNGNLKGIAELCKGKKAEEIIDTLKGIKCGFKPTSCPDQLALALIEATKNEKA